MQLQKYATEICCFCSHNLFGKGVIPKMTSPEMTLLEVTCPEVTWPEVTSVTWPEVTSQEVTLFFPRFFLTRVVVQNVPLLFFIRFTVSDYSFGIFWSLYCLSFDLRLLIIPLESSCKVTFMWLLLPVKRAPLGRILRNFRLRMRRTSTFCVEK